MTNVFLCFRSWRNSCSRESKQFLGGHSRPGHSSWFAIISDKFVVVMVSACAVSDVRMMTGVCWWRTRWHLLVLAATGGGAWPAAWLAAWCAGGAGLARTLQRLHCRCYRHRHHHRAHAALAALPIMIAVQTCHQGEGPAVSSAVCEQETMTKQRERDSVSLERNDGALTPWLISLLGGSFGAALMQHIFWRNSSLSASPLPTAETVFTINTKSWKMRQPYRGKHKDYLNLDHLTVSLLRAIKGPNSLVSYPATTKPLLPRCWL